MLTCIASIDRNYDDEVCIARIPPTGHPENKYITDAEAAIESPGVFYDGREGSFKIQLNKEGKVGPPIVQPNKYEHLLGLSKLLGHEIRDCLNLQTQLADENADIDAVQQQVTNMQGVIDIMNQLPRNKRGDKSVEQLAREVDKVTADLARNAGYDFNKTNPYDEVLESEHFANWQTERQRQYAAVLQMKVLKEVNNNWGSRFPRTDNVWSFAADRLGTKTLNIDGEEVEMQKPVRQFFSMRRWPVERQCDESQAVIRSSGPEVAEKPEPRQQPTAKEVAAARKMKNPFEKTVRHISGRAPMFPFGETPFQQAWLSYQMEQDLKEGKLA